MGFLLPFLAADLLRIPDSPAFPAITVDAPCPFRYAPEDAGRAGSPCLPRRAVSAPSPSGSSGPHSLQKAHNRSDAPLPVALSCSDAMVLPVRTGPWVPVAAGTPRNGFQPLPGHRGPAFYALPPPAAAPCPPALSLLLL